MKRIILTSLFLALTITSCKKNNDTAKVEENTDIKYEVFGDSIPDGTILTANEMFDKYNAMDSNDTIAVQFKSKIDNVCQKKGCWIKLDLKDDAKAFIKFKDYAFFAPMNSANHDAIVSGKAYIKVISVDELKHYAQDAGKTEEEINQITEPKVTYAFMADGIKIAI